MIACLVLDCCGAKAVCKDSVEEETEHTEGGGFVVSFVSSLFYKVLISSTFILNRSLP